MSTARRSRTFALINVSCLQFAATIAVQCVLHSLDARVYRARPAPAPDNINWPMLWRSNGERRWRRPVAFASYAFIMAIPVGIFGGLLTQVRYFHPLLSNVCHALCRYVCAFWHLQQ